MVSQKPEAWGYYKKSCNDFNKTDGCINNIQKIRAKTKADNYGEICE